MTQSDFDIAYAKTAAHEGGYVHDPVDRGGETYKGISRRWHPNWAGWRIVDKEKPFGGIILLDDVRLLNNRLAQHSGLQELVKAFYRDHYWDPIGAPHLPHEIAEELFDSGVNVGTERVVRWLQRCLNKLNYNGQLYTDLVVDGRFGPRTLAAAQAIINRDEVRLLHKMLNVLQGAHYMNLMRAAPEQQRFARGWFSRVEFLPL